MGGPFLYCGWLVTRRLGELVVDAAFLELVPLGDADSPALEVGAGFVLALLHVAFLGGEMVQGREVSAGTADAAVAIAASRGPLVEDDEGAIGGFAVVALIGEEFGLVAIALVIRGGKAEGAGLAEAEGELHEAAVIEGPEAGVWRLVANAGEADRIDHIPLGVILDDVTLGDRAATGDGLEIVLPKAEDFFEVRVGVAGEGGIGDIDDAVDAILEGAEFNGKFHVRRCFRRMTHPRSRIRGCHNDG